MFYNMATKLRILSVVVFFAGIISSIVLGIRIIDLGTVADGVYYEKFGRALIFGGIISTMVLCFVLLGLAELIENSDTIAQKTDKSSKLLAELIESSNTIARNTKKSSKLFYDARRESNRYNSCSNEVNRENAVRVNSNQKEKTEQDVISDMQIEHDSAFNHAWRCDNCGNMIDSYPCEYCGKQESKKDDD